MGPTEQPKAGMPFRAFLGLEVLAASPEQVRARLAWVEELCTAGDADGSTALESVPMRTRLLLPLVLVALSVGLAGAPVASAATPRLSKAQWSAYVKAHTPYLSQTTKTVARFRKCRSGTAYTSYLKAFAACLGTTPAAEAAATNVLFNTLHRFQGKVGGNCAKSLSTYQTALYFWRSVVVGISRAVKQTSSSVSTVEGQVQNGVTAAQKVNTDATAFTRACKPRA